MSFLISWERAKCMIEMSGDVSVSEIETINNRLVGDHRFDALRYCFWDVSKVASMNLEAIDIEMSAAIHKGASLHNPFVRKAILATNDTITNLVEKYLETSRELETSWTIGLFRERQEALRWLDAGKTETDAQRLALGLSNVMVRFA